MDDGSIRTVRADYLLLRVVARPSKKSRKLCGKSEGAPGRFGTNPDCIASDPSRFYRDAIYRAAAVCGGAGARPENMARARIQDFSKAERRTRRDRTS